MKNKEEFILLNQNQQQGTQAATQMPATQQFGGYELLGIHEILGGFIGTLEHNAIFKEHIKDPQLVTISERQKNALTQIYNTIVETLKTGQNPTTTTQAYTMQESNTAIYGLNPSTPKTPIQSMSEITDTCISGAMLGHVKGIASHCTTAAIESTNPILRRILADSVPNLIEMAYEIFLYQNKRGDYQVAQISQEHVQIISNTFAPIQQNMTH